MNATCSKIQRLTAAVALCCCVCAKGETVTAEPDAFLDYIEANGSQYIDTGVNAETGLKARCDFSWADKVGDNDDWSLLDAATYSTDSEMRTRIFLCHMLNQKPFFAMDSSSAATLAGPSHTCAGNGTRS